MSTHSCLYIIRNATPYQMFWRRYKRSVRRYAVPPPDLPVRGEQMPLIVVPALNKDPYVRMECEDPELDEDYEFRDEPGDDQREWACRLEFPSVEGVATPAPTLPSATTHPLSTSVPATPLPTTHSPTTAVPTTDSASPSDRCRVVMQRLACRMQPLAEYRVDWCDRLYVEMACSTVAVFLRPGGPVDEGDEDGKEEGDTAGGVLELRLRSERSLRRSRDDFRELVKTLSSIANAIPGLPYFMWKSN